MLTTWSMKAEFLTYWNSLWNDIPMWVYGAGLLVLLAGLVIFSLTYGIRKGLRYGLGLLLIEYVLLIYNFSNLPKKYTE